MPPSSKLLTAKQLETRWGCTRQTISARIKMGLPCETPGKKRGRLFDFERCEKWRLENMVSIDHGGTRDGAGAPKSNGTAAAATPASPPDQGLLPHKRRLLEIEAERESLKLRKELGDTISIDAVRGAVKRMIEATRYVVESMPAEMAPAMLAALNLRPDSEGIVVQVAERFVDKILETLRADPLGQNRSDDDGDDDSADRDG